MSPRTREQFDEMRSRSRQAIMEAALELFTHRGYHGSSISVIAKQAGVSTGLMYNYFESKAELLEAIVLEGIVRIEEMLGEIQTIEDPHQKIAAMVETSFEIAVRDMSFWSLYFSVLMQPDLPRKVQRVFADFFQDMFAILEGLMGQLGYADPKAEARILAAILDGALLHYWMVGGVYPVEEVKKLIIEKYCKS